MCEHLGNSYKTGKSRKLSQGQITAIHHHIITSGHTGKFGDFKMRCQVNSNFELLIKESSLIDKYKPNLNKQINTFQFSFLIWI